jgi:cytochrome oxidase assembly protein ShyY1
VAFAILAKLGLWQIQRGEEKQQRLSQIAQYQKLDVLTLTSLLQLSDDYEPTGVTVKIDGTFANPASWLLDNKVVKGQTGYDILLALQVVGQPKAVLVNMGWLKSDYAKRDVLPQFVIPAKQVSITGFVKAKDLASFALSDESANKQQWPLRIQQINLDKMAEQSGLSFYPFVVYAQQDNDFGFTHHYQPVVMPPEKHRAYALTWFLLALAVVIIFIFASRETISENNNERS